MQPDYRKFIVDDRCAGSRLDEFLAARIGDLSRMRIGNLIAAGECLVNGFAARAGQHLAARDLIELRIVEQLPGAMSPDPIELEILFEDEQLLVIVKPPGMLVHPTLSVKRGTLANALTYHLNRCEQLSNRQSEIDNPHSFIRPGIVHRLDRATSGLMVVAKTQRSLSLLSKHFSKRLVEKRYIAVVRGWVEQESGRIDAPIGRDPLARPHWRVLESGRADETRFRVLERRAGATLVELEPVTGRSNQLRIHMAFIGHPIVGDETWCDASARTGPDANPGAASPEARLLLHASRLAFHHPSGGQWLEFVSEPDSCFAEPIES